MKAIAERCNVMSSQNINKDLLEIIGKYPKTFLLMDEGSAIHCRSIIGDIPALTEDNTIVIPQGDDHKNAENALRIWNFLSSHGATRNSLLINLGGGMICDLGGFCASTFKRGMDFVNVPTTVLAQVDASLGGKTGMNLGNLKNEIGVFSMARYVLICRDFLKTLDTANILSGFAEMIKHALIHDATSLNELLSFDFENPDYDKLSSMIADSIKIKEFFVESDPKENGLRKALNFGHTFGHAFETFALRHNRPVLHGYAVAWGMICELYLASELSSLDKNEAKTIADRIIDLYGKPDNTANDYNELIELMTHDKKNNERGINFSLLPRIGDVKIDYIAPLEAIENAFRFIA